MENAEWKKKILHKMYMFSYLLFSCLRKNFNSPNMIYTYIMEKALTLIPNLQK